MLNSLPMRESGHGEFVSAVFITFPGNCRKALTYYQTCFGGALQFETFEKELEGYTEKPVISGSLISGSIIIYGSDLVHNEGRTVGNYLSIFLLCQSKHDRQALIEKLRSDKKHFPQSDDDQKLIEITDAFDVQWILSIQ